MNNISEGYLKPDTPLVLKAVLRRTDSSVHTDEIKAAQPHKRIDYAGKP